MGGLFGGKPDNSAAQRQIEESRRENERMRMQTEEERRELSAKEAARRSARLRGGSRMLLSEARVAPEEGITTLGTTGVERQA
jgi:hypothetical protein